jgi:glycosyltransferase involved in cell wall biosynthesis
MKLVLDGRETKRVGFVLEPHLWLGGRNYFRNLLIAISQLPDSAISPIVISGSQSRFVLPELPSVEIIQTPMMDRGTLPWLVRKVVANSPSGDRLLYQLLRLHRIAVLSHHKPLVSNSAIVSVGWIPDFQHVHLPKLFMRKELRTRDRQFMELCIGCDKVIVSSECALADLRAFAPQHAWKGEVLHFVATPSEQTETPSLVELQQRYGFDGPYFVLPNQFWKHKNHRVVIAALDLLKRRGQRVLVIATGRTRDDRHPEHVDALMRYAKECAVTDRFRSLGEIPYSDLCGLMQHAIALINPSLFEGWSTSVEESKSLGKQIVLSDIPVHREQSPALAAYFPPDDADDLARQIWNTQKEFDPDVDSNNREQARLSLPARQIQFARTFQRIMLSERRPLVREGS